MHTAEELNAVLRAKLSCDRRVIKKGISCFSLARIADYFDVPDDYLIGRTDKPEVNR